MLFHFRPRGLWNCAAALTLLIPASSATAQQVIQQHGTQHSNSNQMKQLQHGPTIQLNGRTLKANNSSGMKQLKNDLGVQMQGQVLRMKDDPADNSSLRLDQNFLRWNNGGRSSAGNRSSGNGQNGNGQNGNRSSGNRRHGGVQQPHAGARRSGNQHHGNANQRRGGVQHGRTYVPHVDLTIDPWSRSRYDVHRSYFAPSIHGGTTVRNYYVPTARPPVTSSRSSTAKPEPSGWAYQRRAEAAFRDGDYQTALRQARHALIDRPQDGKLYLLTAQTLLALGDYRSSAAAIHQGVSLLDDKDWGYVVENYDRYYRGRRFVEQIKRLGEYLKANPEAAEVYFVRGYQFGFLGYRDVAVDDLSRAFELEPRDELAARLIERFGGRPKSNSAVAPTP